MSKGTALGRRPRRHRGSRARRLDGRDAPHARRRRRQEGRPAAADRVPSACRSTRSSTRTRRRKRSSSAASTLAARSPTTRTSGSPSRCRSAPRSSRSASSARPRTSSPCASSARTGTPVVAFGETTPKEAGAWTCLSIVEKGLSRKTAKPVPDDQNIPVAKREFEEQEFVVNVSLARSPNTSKEEKALSVSQQKDKVSALWCKIAR